MTTTHGGKEYELKLWVDHSDLRRISRAPWFRRMEPSVPRRRQLQAVYFDTPDLALFKNRAAFRIRKESGRYVQCLKRRLVDAAGAVARQEYEHVVRGIVPDLDAFDNADLEGIISRDDGSCLAPVFETRIKRTIRYLTCPDGTKIEFDTDVGDILAGNKSVEVCEIELELREGDPSQLFRVAELVLDTVPARLGVGTKASRGYELLRGSVNQWRRATKLSLSRDDSVEDAFVRALLNAIDHLRSNEQCVMFRTHAEGVHQMRIAVRRMRSALSICKAVVPSQQYAFLHGELKWLLDELGPARDMDVFQSELLNPVADAIPDERMLTVLRQRADKRCDDCYRVAQEAVASKRYTKLILRLSEWLLAREWRQGASAEQEAILARPVREFADSVLDTRLKRVRKRGKRPKSLDDTQLHDLRIEVKKLRYTAEFFRTLYPKTKRYLAMLRQLQDEIGQLNDICVARELLNVMTGDDESGADPDLRFAFGLVLGWHTRRVAQSDGACADKVKRLRAAAPFWRI